MWLYDDVVLFEEPQIHIRLITQHVHTCPADLSTVEGSLKSSFIDDGSASNVGEGPVHHRRELRLRDQVLNFRIQWVTDVTMSNIDSKSRKDEQYVVL